MSASITRVARARSRVGRRSTVAMAVAALALVASACVFDGTWTALPAPVVPVQALSTQLDAVSCPTDDWCMAVGVFGDLPLVEIWDGTAWSVGQAPPIDSQWEVLGNGRLVSVDCGTPTACVAEIWRFHPSEPNDFQFLVLWNGVEWLEVPPGGQIDGPYVHPAAASCSPDGTCLVLNQTGQATVRWDGTSFTTSAGPETLFAYADIAVSDCVDGDDCIVATDLHTFHWDGASWTSIPGAGAAIASLGVDALPQMACASTSDCTAFAYQQPGNVPVGLHFDGTSWTVHDLPPSADGPDVGDDIRAVSCASPGQCVALAGPPATPVLLAWNGDQWFEAPQPPASARALSCRPLRCLAVGSSGTPSVPTAAGYTWTNP